MKAIAGDAKECQRLLAKAFQIDNVFQKLCIEKDKYKKELTTLYKDNVLDYYYGLKIQYVYPLVSDSKFTYIPSPYLVINAVKESLLNRLTSGNDMLRKKFGKDVIESICSIYTKKFQALHGLVPKLFIRLAEMNFRTPDVIVSEEIIVLFYDTKALSPSLKIRQFNQEEIEREIKNMQMQYFRSINK
jgi:hypothetical protein